MWFNEKQLLQLKAALIFWRAVTKQSRVPPIEHPSVRPLYEQADTTPLTDVEIDFLLNNWEFVEPDAVPLTTLNQAAKGGGVSVYKIRKGLQKRGIEPTEIKGGMKFYPVDIITEIIECNR